MILLLSGGQDSTALLFYALKRGYGNIHALSINYGQTHQRELDAACRVVAVAGFYYPHAKITHEVLNVGRGVLNFRPQTDIIPVRNLFFLSIAANRCATLGHSVIGIGVCGADSQTFADCRPAFVAAAGVAVSKSFDDTHEMITIVRPFIDKTKKEIIELCGDIAGCDDAIALSLTCYKGTDEPCQKCAACIARADGFAAAGKADPLWVRLSGGAT